MHPVFDIRTLFFIGALTCLICAVMLHASRKLHRPSIPAIGWATALEACMAAAMLLIALRGAIPDTLSIVLANALGTGGAALLFESVRRLTGAPPMTAFAIGAFSLGAASQIALGTAPEWHLQRLLVSSAFQGGFALAVLPCLIARRGLEPTIPLNWAIGFGATYALAHAARTVHTLASGVTVAAGGMVTGNTTVVLVVALFALTPMIYAMIVLGMVNGRVAIELRQLATTDTLTGLLNRRSFLERGDATLRAAIARGETVALMMLDLDRFKTINDTHGHAAGDRALRHFARVLRRTAPPESAIGRYGGEEFCLLAHGSDPGSLIEAAETIVNTLRSEPVANEARPIALTVSAGVAIAPTDGTSIEDLLLAADRRVYLAKAFGRNRAVAADQAPHERPVRIPSHTLVPV